MANPLDIVIRMFSQGADDVAADFEDVANAGENLDESLANSTRSMQRMQAFEGLSNAGEKLSSMGAGAMQMADGWQAASEEGRGIEQRLDSILSAQKRLADSETINNAVQKVTIEGNFDDDDEIREGAVLMASYSVETQHMGQMMEITARQARTMNASVSGTANAFAKAYNTGNIAALAKSGVTMSKQEVAAVKAAYGVSQLAGQMKFMQVVGKAVTANTVGLNDSLTETQKQANATARAADDMQTALGKGSAEAKANIQQILGQFVELAGGNAKLLEAGGAMTVYGGTVATAGGATIGLVGSIGQAVMGAHALGITSKASMLAFAASAGAVVIALGLIITTAAAAYKAYMWTQDAISKSDEDMANGTAREAWVYRSSNVLSNAAGALSPSLKKGDSDEEKAAAIYRKAAEKRAGNKQSTSPNGDTVIRIEPITIKKPKAAKAFR